MKRTEKEIRELLDKLSEQEKSLTKEEIMALAEKIKPVMRKAGDSLHILSDNDNVNKEFPLCWIKPRGIHSQSFSFMAENPIMEAVGLTEVARIQTYHRCGSPVLLKPSVEEVIVQCPKELLDKICAFELVRNSQNMLYDDELGRHVLTAIFYTGELPKEIAEQEVVW